MTHRVPTPYGKSYNKSVDIAIKRKLGHNKKNRIKNYLSYFGNTITKHPGQEDNEIKSFEIEEEVFNIITGDSHIFLLTKSNQILGLGDNSFGQLGLEPEFKNVSLPQQLRNINKIPISSLFSGSDHCFALTRKGEVYGWGLNAKGQLGLGHYENIYTPAKIKGLSHDFSSSQKLQLTTFQQNIFNNNEVVANIACGALHSILVTNKNRVFSCGFGETYALGHGNTKTIPSFKEVKYFSDLKEHRIDKIAAGVTHSGCLINGQLYVWGKLGNSRYLIYQKPNTIVIEKEIINFELGDFLTVVLTASKEVYTMGENIDFQLGHRHNNSLTPVKVNLPRKIESIGCGLNHVIVTTKSRVYGWGSNRFNQLNPFSNELFFEDLVELLWIREAFAMVIKCAPLQTFVVTQRKVSNFQDDNDKKIQELQILIENFKRKTEKLKKENVQLTGNMEELYQTLNHLDLEIKDGESNSSSKKEFNNIMEKFKSELKKNRTLMPSFEINFQELRFANKLSEGAYGIIFKGKWRELKIAIKTLRKEHKKEETIKDFLNECSALQSLRHPNIVLCLGCCTKKPSQLAIVLEYCPNDTLWNLLHKHEIVLKWKKRYQMALGIARGMNYLHSFQIPIIHRDLKSLNILLDAFLNPKITDFGWSRLMAKNMTGKIGTFQWMAPEVISTKFYSEKADVYSYGIILWEIASREPPYKNIQGRSVIVEVVKNNIRPEIPSDCPKQFAKLIKKCWATNPNQRPSFKDIILELKALRSKTLEQQMLLMILFNLILNINFLFINGKQIKFKNLCN